MVLGVSGFSNVAGPLLPGQDKSAPSSSMLGVSCFVVSCGFKLSEVGLSEVRKPQVIQFLPRDVILFRLPP